MGIPERCGVSYQRAFADYSANAKVTATTVAAFGSSVSGCAGKLSCVNRVDARMRLSTASSVSQYQHTVASTGLQGLPSQFDADYQSLNQALGWPDRSFTGAGPPLTSPLSLCTLRGYDTT